jgi:hypothetical protein
MWWKPYARIATKHITATINSRTENVAATSANFGNFLPTLVSILIVNPKNAGIDSSDTIPKITHIAHKNILLCIFFVRSDPINSSIFPPEIWRQLFIC